jgi:hypothetical protein
MLEILILYIYLSYMKWSTFLYLQRLRFFRQNSVLKHTIPGYRVSVEYTVFQNTLHSHKCKNTVFFWQYSFIWCYVKYSKLSHIVDYFVIYVVIWYFILYNTIQYNIILYCTVLYCTVLYCTVLYCTVLHFTVLYCNVQYCTVLYCTVLYCTTLYCTVVYCTVKFVLLTLVSVHIPLLSGIVHGALYSQMTTLIRCNVISCYIVSFNII